MTALCIKLDTSNRLFLFLTIHLFPSFESLSHNGLERLLINYCAERVQAAVTGATLRREQREYCREGLPWRALPYLDHEANAELLDHVSDILTVSGVLTVSDILTVRETKDSECRKLMNNGFDTIHPCLTLQEYLKTVFCAWFIVIPLPF